MQYVGFFVFQVGFGIVEVGVFFYYEVCWGVVVFVGEVD